MAPMINLRNISKTYPGQSETAPVLRDICLEIEAGDYICITGRSGSGKTTLLDIITTLMRTSTGSYLFNGQDVMAMSDKELAALRNQHFGFVFQSFYLISSMTVLENVCLPNHYRQQKDSTPERRARSILEELEIADLADRLPEQLSGGQKQRVALARSLLNDPEVIIADEPTGNLDRQSGALVLAALHRLNAAGKTILLVTHDEAVAAHAHRRVVLREGVIAA
jgi:ABC-type lipoprotein export system ATPase subunit